ncbi:MAG: phage tail domain-containing protein [Agathobacter sp.]
MNMKAGIRINEKHSYEDFGLYISDSEIGLPERNLITATVPFMNGYYDFSSICGGKPYYKQRKIKYSFDITADDILELETTKNKICAWLETADQSEIYDDADPDYHFIGSLTKIDWKPDGEEYGLLTATFTCQPFRVSNSDKTEVI